MYRLATCAAGLGCARSRSGTEAEVPLALAAAVPRRPRFGTSRTPSREPQCGQEPLAVRPISTSSHGVVARSFWESLQEFNETQVVHGPRIRPPSSQLCRSRRNPPGVCANSRVRLLGKPPKHAVSVERATPVGSPSRRILARTTTGTRTETGQAADRGLDRIRPESTGPCGVLEEPARRTPDAIAAIATRTA